MRLLAIAIVVALGGCQLVYPTHELMETADAGATSADAAVDAGADAPAVEEWPGPSNTGPLDASLTPSGAITIATEGRVVDGLAIDGTVTINASNVTLSHCRVTTAEVHAIEIDPAATGVKIEDCEIAGAQTNESTGINGPATVTRCSVHGFVTGVSLVGNSVGVRDSYIWGLDAKNPGSSFYGVKMDGPSANASVTHNVIEHDRGQTAAVGLSNFFGAQTNIVIDRNILRGSGYPFVADGSFDGGTVSGVKLTNNRLKKGAFGYVLLKAIDVEVENNVDDDTGNPAVF